MSITTFSELSGWFRTFDLLGIGAGRWTLQLHNADWTGGEGLVPGQTIPVLQQETVNRKCKDKAFLETSETKLH